MTKDSVTVIGAGLCGSLLAIRLAQLGYEIDVFEKQPDRRISGNPGGRSINLALSDRGLRALKDAGLEEEILKMCIPMYGRMIHDMGGATRLSRYSGRQSDYINSISRPGLNGYLLTVADQYPNLRLHSEHKCTKVDVEESEVYLTDLRTGKEFIHQAGVIFGADGAGSAVRRSYLDSSARLLFDYSQNFLEYGYKELTIPAGEEGAFQMEENALHIWPRESFMLIALPNLDGSFTVTLFLPYQKFQELGTTKQRVEFFIKYFKDAEPFLDMLLADFEENPIGSLGTIRCFPWVANGKTVLIGDAAHAIVPFYGQGMNAAFEDVTVFLQFLEKAKGNWRAAFEEYQISRKPDTDAIAQLAMDNFVEMRDLVDDPIFIKKRKLEMQLEKNNDEYYSKYSLVTFREDLSYSKAKIIGEKQDQLLITLLGVEEEVDEVRALEYVKENLKDA